MNFFSVKSSIVHDWLQRKGYQGTYYDSFLGYVKDRSTLTEGTIYDHLQDCLIRSGYNTTGSNLDDMLRIMFQQKTGIDFRRDAERKFFEDINADMFEIGLRDDDGNLVRDDDGTIVLGDP